MIRTRTRLTTTGFVIVATRGLAVFLLIVTTARCSRSGPVSTPSPTLRIGIGGVPQQAQEAGLRQMTGSLSSLEGLVVPYEDGRLRAWLADSWTTSPDGLSVIVSLRHNAKFHDATPVTAAVVADVLKKGLPPLLGPAFSDVREITALSDWQLKIDFKRPSRFVVEALETPIRKPGSPDVGSGPYLTSATNSSQLLANTDYYLGRPNIDRIEFVPYATVRAAWAELLRGNIDMLYEVNIDALDSLQSSNNIAVYSYVRHYQYVLTFGSGAEALAPREVRRALNAAINRDGVIRSALGGHGIPSTGPVPPGHWALDQSAPRIGFDPQLAKTLAARHLRFTCLVPADSSYDRVAIAVKQQLATAGVDMRIQEAPQEEILKATQGGHFEAVLVDPIGGPSLFRSYRQFYSKTSFNPKPRSSAKVDATLDMIRHAVTDDEYRAAVSAFQQAIVDDPPALFLAWGERARAVSRRFDVVTEEKGRDILINLRLWRPAGMHQVVSRN